MPDVRGPRPGLLLSFDGTDSSGKATQASLLAKKIEQSGRVVGQFATPDYSTNTGRQLKALFQASTGQSWNDLGWQAQMKLLAANRAEHREEVMAVLAQNGVVIYDRYVPSSIAHMAVSALDATQISSGRHQIQAVTKQHEYIDQNMPHEDLSIFLDVPPAQAAILLSNRKSNTGNQDEVTDDIALQTRIYKEYHWYIKHQADRFCHIVCTQGDQLKSPAAIAGLVWQAVVGKFPSLGNDQPIT